MTSFKKAFLSLVLVFIVGGLSWSQATWAGVRESQAPKPVSAETRVGDEASGILSDQMAADAVRLITENKLNEASKKINEALSLRIDRSYYHLLNGLIYHLQARQGNNGAYGLAEQGYAQAIQFDHSNWQAYYYSGLLNIDLSRFAKAQEQFAEALLYRSDDPALLKALAYAAYRSGSPDIAAGAINALEKLGAQSNALELRNSAMAMAAVGDQEKARQYLNRLKALPASRLTDNIERRISDWGDFYRQFGAGKATSLESAPADGLAGRIQLAVGEVPAAPALPPAVELAQAFPPPQPPGQPPPAPGAPDPGPPLVVPESSKYKMVVLDVVMVYTEENITSSKGVNLLSGLQIQFGSTKDEAYSRSNSETYGGATPIPDQTVITRALSIPMIAYTLNIANTYSVRNEVLARPTLIATSGKLSEFFSGVELNAAVSGGAIGAAPIQIQKEIGTKLAVTPVYLEDGKISMKVTAQRTFITTPNNQVNFTFVLQTSKSSVDANVVMRIGETLILGGLSEKEADTSRDGVPLLQDIPVLQYLFSQHKTLDFQKSVLILITPRSPQYIYQPEKAREEYEKSLSEDERSLTSLRARYSDWFKPYPNWASAFNHLQKNSLYREFRTGDVALENWSDQQTLKDRLGKIKDFLYY
ncbi:MAG: hypothetical protein ACOYOS_18840 [Syntrophales bacterium]